MEIPVENKKFDLGSRTLCFSQKVRSYTSSITVSIHNADDIKQLIRSSGSIGANYIEAEDAISAKDFLHRIKISRKEAKETIYWLRLISTSSSTPLTNADSLIDEASQLMKIFGRIINNAEQKSKR